MFCRSYIADKVCSSCSSWEAPVKLCGRRLVQRPLQLVLTHMGMGATAQFLLDSYIGLDFIKRYMARSFSYGLHSNILAPSISSPRIISS